MTYYRDYNKYSFDQGETFDKLNALFNLYEDIRKKQNENFELADPIKQLFDKNINVEQVEKDYKDLRIAADIMDKKLVDIRDLINATFNELILIAYGKSTGQ